MTKKYMVRAVLCEVTEIAVVKNTNGFEYIHSTAIPVAIGPPLNNHNCSVNFRKYPWHDIKGTIFGEFDQKEFDKSELG